MGTGAIAAESQGLAERAFLKLTAQFLASKLGHPLASWALSEPRDNTQRNAPGIADPQVAPGCWSAGRPRVAEWLPDF